MNKGKTFKIEPLTTQECRALLQATSKGMTGLRNKALIVTLWRAGLRIREALSLHPRDFNNGVLRIRNGKGDKSRVVALDPEAMAVIQIWMDRKQGLEIAGPVFSTLKGLPLSSAYVRNLFKRLGVKAGIEKRVHPHGLRHTCAYQLMEEGSNIKVIQGVLGHSSVVTTARYIDHLLPTAVIDALKARTW